MKKVYFFLAFIISKISIINSLYYQYYDIINSNKIDSLNQIIEKKFINKLLEENYSDFCMERTDQMIEISYKDSKFGYNYNSSYKIFKVNDYLYNIYYENNYLKNNIELELLKENTIKVNLTLNSSYPIPRKFLNYIIKKKISYLEE